MNRNEILKSSCIALLLFLAAVTPSSACNYLQKQWSDCPEGVVRTDAKEESIEKVPLEGWFATLVGGEIFVSPLGEWSPKLVPNLPSNRIRRTELSNDGEWVLFNVDGSSGDDEWWIIRRDGAGLKRIPHVANDMTFYRGSPYGDEIAMIDSDARKVFAMKVGFDGSNASFGDKRTLSDGLSKYGYKGGGELAVSVDVIYYRDGGGNGAGILIPDGGRGKSNGETYYYDGEHCGQTVSWDGKWLIHNFGHHIPEEWIPREHKGFTREPWRKNSRGTKSVAELRAGQISTTWAPEKYRSYENWRDEQFHHYKITEHPDWVAAIHEGNKAATKGGFLIHIPSNTWYKVTDPDVAVKRIDVHVTNVPTTGLLPENRTRLRLPERSTASTGYDALGRWLDVRGVAGLRMLVPAMKKTETIIR